MCPVKGLYGFTDIGYNYRMTNLQAALGVAQLERLDYFISRKREIAAKYKKYLEAYVTPHPCQCHTKLGWLCYTILHSQG